MYFVFDDLILVYGIQQNILMWVYANGRDFIAVVFPAISVKYRASSNGVNPLITLDLMTPESTGSAYSATCQA